MPVPVLIATSIQPSSQMVMKRVSSAMQNSCVPSPLVKHGVCVSAIMHGGGFGGSGLVGGGLCGGGRTGGLQGGGSAGGELGGGGAGR